MHVCKLRHPDYCAAPQGRLPRAHGCACCCAAATDAAAELQRLPAAASNKAKLVQRLAAGAGSLETLYSRTLAPNLSTLPTRSCLATWSGGGVGRWVEL